MDFRDVVPLVGITGAAGSGKSTVAEFFITAYGARCFSFADPIKEAVNIAFGLPVDIWEDREQKERVIPAIGRSPRYLAQTLGTDWGRMMVSKNVWVNQLITRWRDAGSPFAVIPDVRFNNEAAAISKLGGLILRTHRPNRETVRAHSSERGISSEYVHATIVNDRAVEDLTGAAEDVAYWHAIQRSQIIGTRQHAEAS